MSLISQQENTDGKAVNVLVVDDSGFIRKTVKTLLENNPHIHVVGEAVDGEEAIRMAEWLKPDVITMDLNMPNMDGITATRKILKKRSVPIFIFTSVSEHDGPRVLEALNAGAVDFISKDSGDISEREKIIRRLQSGILAFGNHADSHHKVPVVRQPVIDRSVIAQPLPGIAEHDYDVIVMGASTGGPVVIENILSGLDKNFPVPVLIVQHMPAEFTRAFADRLNGLCPIRVVEATHGMAIEPGTVYLAPGGKQMEVLGKDASKRIYIGDHGENVNYKPSVDVTFKSVAARYGNKALAIILTGMGADGVLGAEVLKKEKAMVWAQDRESSVVFGMPMEIINHNLADKVLSATEIGTRLAQIH